MKKTFFLYCAAYLLIANFGYALDLTPRFVTRVTDNQSELIPYFTDGDTKYSMEMPRGVSASQDDGNVVFRFRDLDGKLTIKPSPLKPSDLFSGSTLETYRKEALALVPPQATDVVLKQEASNPLSFNGWASYRVTYGYKFPGRTFLLSATFLNFSEKQQILLVTTGTPSDFERIESLSYHLLGAWRQLRPGESIAVPPPM